MRMDSKLEISLLYDFYKELLNNSQQQVIELYVNDDLSLSEVADILSISRQGVRDSLNRATKKLRDYENKLHFYQNYNEQQQTVGKILGYAKEIRGSTDDSKIIGLCDRLIDDTEKLMEREEQHGI